MPTKNVSIRMPEELLSYLRARADKEHRTLTNMVVAILTDDMEKSIGAYNLAKSKGFQGTEQDFFAILQEESASCDKQIVT